MLNHYRKLIKKKFRESKQIYKKNRIYLVGINSVSFNFVFNILREVNKKNNIQLEINTLSYESLEDIKIPDTYTLLVLPSEVILTIFLANMVDNYGFLEFLSEKGENFFNVGFYLSETKLSKLFNKKRTYFTCKWRIIEDFVSEMFLLNDKFHKSSVNLIKKLYQLKFFAN